MSSCLRHREARQRRGDPVQHAQRVHLRLLDCFASLAMTVLAAGVFALSASAALADDISCVSTTFRLVGRNDQVCVSAFDDPKVPGVACHISQARTGGVGGSLGLAEDPSRFSISCRQIGPITADIGNARRSREGLRRAHLGFLQAHQRLQDRGQEAQYPRLSRDQRQADRGLAAERDLDRANHALGRRALSKHSLAGQRMFA